MMAMVQNILYVLTIEAMKGVDFVNMSALLYKTKATEENTKTLKATCI